MQKSIGQIIILNGPSSAGKSTIARHLQQQSPIPMAYLSMDDFLNSRPPSEENPKGTIRLMAENVAELLRKGNNVIVDCVAFPNAMKIWMDVLGKYNPFLVALTTPLYILEERENARGDRELGMAKSQHGQLFKGMTYDFEIDTSATQPEEAAARIISKAFSMKPVQKPIAGPSL